MKKGDKFIPVKNIRVFLNYFNDKIPDFDVLSKDKENELHIIIQDKINVECIVDSRIVDSWFVHWYIGDFFILSDFLLSDYILENFKKVY